MRFDKFTLKLQEAFEHAETASREMGHQQISREHLLDALLAQEGGVAVNVLRKLGCGIEALSAELAEGLGRKPRVEGSGADQLYLEPEVRGVLDQAFREADQFHDEYVSTEHLLLALAGESSGPGRRVVQAPRGHPRGPDGRSARYPRLRAHHRPEPRG